MKKQKQYAIAAEHSMKVLPPSWWYDFGWTREMGDAKRMTEDEAKKLLAVMMKDSLLQLQAKGYDAPIVRKIEGTGDEQATD